MFRPLPSFTFYPGIEELCYSNNKIFYYNMDAFDKAYWHEEAAAVLARSFPACF